MSIQSGAVVFNFEDPTDFYAVINFLEQHPGIIRIIYKTMRTNDRLYITSESKMKQGV